MLIHGAIARAAGGIGDKALYDRSSEAVLQLAGAHPQHASSALNGLAEGAAAFGAWDQADLLAAAAPTLARARQDGAEQAVAEKLLDRIARQEMLPAETGSGDRERLQALLQRLLSRLHAWEAAHRVPPRGTTCADPLAGAAAEA